MSTTSRRQRALANCERRPDHGRPGSGLPETREETLGVKYGDDGIEAEYCREWEALLETAHHDDELAIRVDPRARSTLPGPTGSLMLRLAGPRTAWPTVGRPEAAAFRGGSSSFADTADVVLDALSLQQRAATSQGVSLVEVIPDDSDLGPAAARPFPRSAGTIHPHGPFGHGLDGVVLAIDRQRRPWLRREHVPGVFVPNGVAAAGYDDRCSRLLLALSRAHGWEFLSFPFPPSHAELTHWRQLPRIVTSSGTVLSGRRSMIDAT